jgi:hypothetical protein
VIGDPLSRRESGALPGTRRRQQIKHQSAHAMSRVQWSIGPLPSMTSAHGRFERALAWAVQESDAAAVVHGDVRRVSLSVSMMVFAIATLGPATANAATSGTTYYVRAGGNDSADGRTIQTAWRSVSRVNQAVLRPADAVLFNAGDRFQGGLYVAPGGGGASGSPVSFGSYGVGRGIINGGTRGAFFAYDAAGIAISNLNFVGTGATTNTQDGVGFYNDEPGIKLAYVRISNVDVAGFGGAGISIGGWNGSSGFTDVQVTRSTVHDNRRTGLLTYGPPFTAAAPSYANSNVYVGHVSAYNNLGDPRLTTNSGSGIVLGSVQSGTVERSVAWGNGSLCSARQCGAGIWTYDSTAITIQYNESYSNLSSSRVDGDGFDLDQNVSNSLLQYNYSHNNGGPGFLDYSGVLNSAHTGNVLRYNISENDAGANDGAVTVGGYVLSDSIYNNTIFVSASAGRTVVALEVVGAPSSVTVRNNILDGAPGAALVNSPALGTMSVLFQQNDYSAAFTARWGSSVYTNLDTWRSATGQELLGAVPSGLASDPMLANPGRGGTLGNADLLSTLAAYRLQISSPMHAAGLDLLAMFGLASGGHDFYGVAVAAGGAPAIGASES